MGEAVRIAEAAIERASARPKLRVRRLGLTYESRNGSVVALNDISFEVADKEFAVLVGPSSCGKSSLLYLAAGLIDPTDGEILINDQVIEGPGADRGMVFQAYTLFPWLNVTENVEFGLKRRKIPAAERKVIVERFLAEVGLTQFAGAYPKELSGGMMQRVAIARSLANNPEILLMDEPFGALDSQTRSQMQKLLLRVWENTHKTVLFVTYDIDEAILLGDRVYVMTGRPGRIQEEIAIGFPHPRSMDLVLDPQFLMIKRRILQLLHGDLDDE
jgi:NitT/TauT family transport system ATP-binding protein